MVVKHGTYTSGIDSRNKWVASFKSTALNNDGCNYTTSLVNTAFNNLSFRTAVVLGLKLQHLGLDKDCVKKLVYALVFES